MSVSSVQIQLVQLEQFIQIQLVNQWYFFVFSKVSTFNKLFFFFSSLFVVRFDDEFIEQYQIRNCYTKL
jgi:hypothetical protein